MNKHIKILYIVSRLTRSGTNIQLYSLISNLNRDLYQPIIITIYDEVDNSMKKEFIDLNINIYSLNSNHINVLFLKKKLISTVENISPEIIHTSCFSADLFGYLYLRKYNVCTTVHSNPKNYYVVTYGNIIGNLLCFIHINSIKNIKFPVACSKSISDEMKTMLKCSTYVIQNGIDMGKFSLVNNEEKLNIRKKLGFGQDERLFIYVGSLDNRKDPITLIKGFIHAKINDNSKLVILGSGPLEKECKNISNSCVRFLGQVTNVKDYLHACDVFVSASTSEGLPMAVLEAMSTGKPVLLSDIGPHLELFSENSEIGETFETKNIEALSELFIRYSKIKIDKLGDNARSEIELQYNSKIMSKNYQKLYKDILVSYGIKK